MAAIVFPKYVAPSKKGKRITVAPGCAAYVSDRNGIWPAEVINSQQLQRKTGYAAGYDAGFMAGEAKLTKITDAEFEERTQFDLITEGIAIAQQLEPGKRNEFLARLMLAIDAWTNESVETMEAQLADMKERTSGVVTRRLDFLKVIETSGRYELNT